MITGDSGPARSSTLDSYGLCVDTFLYMIQEIKEKGFEPGAYISNVRNYRSLMKKLFDEADADTSHLDRLAEAAASRNVSFASLMTEDWCGDSACNVPILTKLFEQAEIPF